MEFPGIIPKGYKMPEDDTFFVMEEVGKILGVQLESVKLIEIYYDDSIPWRHYIYRAEILSGNPSKIKYEKIIWKFIWKAGLSENSGMYILPKTL